MPEMKGATQRLFVGNIPENVTEEDLKKEFSFYGNIQKVELKTKENLANPSRPSRFAFVTINIDKGAIDQCIEEFRKQTFKGTYLTVSVARESFLDRLKREREEEAARKNKSQSININNNINNNAYNNVSELSPAKFATETANLSKHGKNSKTVNFSKHKKDSESKSSNIGSENESSEKSLLSKIKQNIATISELKKTNIDSTEYSYRDVNQPIKIKSTGNKPLHIIERNKKELKRLDIKAEIADRKRKENLKKMKNEYTKQKTLIQKALSQIDSKPLRKIIFNDGTDEENQMEQALRTSQKKTDIFDMDDEELRNINKDFAIKEHFQGEKGAELMKMQSKFNLDSRFAMDARFLDNNEEGKNQSNHNDVIEHEANDERDWQMGIIEQVIGQKIENKLERKTKKLKDIVCRFDPSKKEHQQFLKNNESDLFDSKTENKFDKIKLSKNKKYESNVSKEQYYNVSVELANSLQKPGNEFSLLGAFGSVYVAQESDTVENEYEEVRIPQNKLDKKMKDLAFIPTDNIDEDKIFKQKRSGTGNSINTGGVLTENFFIFRKDKRLKEGTMFFYANEKAAQTGEEYENIRKKLRLLIRAKITRAKKKSSMQ